MFGFETKPKHAERSLDDFGRRSIEQDIAATDRAIDRLVYQLYDLSAEEISLLEATTPKI